MDAFDQELSRWTITLVTNMADMFKNADALADANKGLIHASFSNNENWPYDWSEFVPEPAEVFLTNLVIAENGDANLTVGRLGFSGPDGKRVSVGEGEKLWSFETGDKIRGSVAVGADGSLYFGSYDKKVYALTSDGVKKWEFTTEGEIRSTPVVGEDGTIYVGSNDLNVYALNPDGTKKWEHFTSSLRFGKVVTSPAIGADGTLYIGTQNGKLRALNQDGTLKLGGHLR